MRLASLTRPELIFPDLRSEGREEILRTLAERVADLGLVRDSGELFRKLWEREQLGSTGIGSGLAIPHCKLPGLRQGIVAIGIAPEGVDFGAADNELVKLFFLVLSPSAAPAEHLQVLATISRWVKTSGNADLLLEQREPAAVVQLFKQESR